MRVSIKGRVFFWVYSLPLQSNTKMSAKRSSSVDPVALNGQEDWETWNHELMSRAVANLWECIDPNVDEEFLEKPEKPGFSQFRKRVVPTQTRSSQASSTSATPAPELLTNEQA